MIETKQVKVEDLKGSEYNPRKWSKEAINNLTKSIREFGFVEPIVVNSAIGRENVIIGGHFRFKVAKLLGFSEVPVVYVNIPSLEKEKELNLRLNKNVGEFDADILKNFEMEMLSEVGFTDKEIEQIFKEDCSGEEVEVEFSEELLEENNYVVLKFKNQIDWLNFLSNFNLKRVQGLSSKPGFRLIGTGRVVDGVEYLNKIIK